MSNAETTNQGQNMSTRISASKIAELEATIEAQKANEEILLEVIERLQKSGKADTHRNMHKTRVIKKLEDAIRSLTSGGRGVGADGSYSQTLADKRIAEAHAAADQARTNSLSRW